LNNMATITTDELLRLKEKIQKGKTRLAELQGQKQQLMKTLDTSYGCKTVEAAEKKVEDQQKKITHLEQQIVTDVEALEEEYPILFE
jgi:predicted  nucleic acid-binding Zn-ribbon protein